MAVLCTLRWQITMEITFEDLFEASRECIKNVSWKSSTQMFQINRLMWLANLKNQIDEETYKPKKGTHFRIHERGKLREIHSVHISDRVVQKAFNQKVLKPKTYPHLIYNNCASQKGKGTDKQLERLKVDLYRHFGRHGRKGYILLIDFSNYFGNIDKEILISKLKLEPDEERLLRLFIEDDEGLGLGSEVNQTGAIFYASSIDHFIKERLHIKGYGRYMDDSYSIHEDRNYLEYCRNEILKECEKLKIKVNPKKVKIIPLTDQFIFLKKRITVTEKGSVTTRPVKENFKRRRRNLRTQRRLLDEGRMTIEEIEQSYRSWRGYAVKNNSPIETIENMDRLYNDLFGKEEENEQQRSTEGDHTDERATE